VVVGAGNYVLEIEQAMSSRNEDYLKNTILLKVESSRLDVCLTDIFFIPGVLMM
jgi:hypothetical protein